MPADYGRIVTTLGRLRARGVRILLDDFGTGFSSLSYLQNLPIDMVKIDRSFVRAIESSSAIIGAIISISRALELSTIAEGVEDPAQAATLRAMGVDYFQGFLYSEPLPEAKAVEWLAGRHSAPASISTGEQLERLSGRLVPCP